jgi:hypothetical protein
MRLIVRTIALLLLAGANVAPAFSQGLDVRSLPGDAPGDKVPFQFSTFVTLGGGQMSTVLIPVPEGSAVTIEAITARAFSGPGRFPNVTIATALGDVAPPVVTSGAWVRHIVALVRKGTNETGSLVYEGTHAVRLHHRSNVVPRFELWNQGAEGSITFYVSAAGYMTATRTSFSATAESQQTAVDDLEQR